MKRLCKDFGKRLARAREEQAISQGQLAARCGLSQSTIARLEKQKKPDPTLSTFFTICEALGYELGEFLEVK